MKKIYTLFLVFLFFSNNSEAQWVTIPGFQVLNSSMQGVGIGNFTLTSPLARMHVSNDLCSTPAGSSNGELLRTDGNTSVANHWRFYTGPSAFSQTERFRLSVDPNSYSTHLKSLNPNLETEMILGDAQVRLNLKNYQIADFKLVPNAPDEIQIGNITCDDNLGTNTLIHGDQYATNNNGFAIWASNHNASLGNGYIVMPPANIQLKINSQANSVANAPDYQSSEVIIDGRVDDAPGSYIRMQNAASLPFKFTPLLAGYNSGNETGLALSAKVPINTDVSTSAAMMEFDVRRGDSTQVSPVQNRNLFRWCNFSTAPMVMNAKGQLGIKPNNTSALSNRVEIEAGPGDYGYTPVSGTAGQQGTSGLRFIKLNAQSATTTNPGSGLLSVNQFGDVIYVPAPIVNCTWDLLGTNDLFTGIAPACRTGNVAIGTITPLAKLHVAKVDLTATTLTAQRIDATGGIATTTGLLSMASGSSSSYVIGVNGVATAGQNKNIGGQFSVNYTSAMLEGIGCLGQANSNLGIGVHTGVKGEATGGKYNIAVNGGAHGNNGAINNIGVYGEATGPGNTWAIFANGAVGSTNGYFVVSDLILKHDPTAITNSAAIINSLQPKSYTFKTGEYPNLNMPSGVHYGLLSQNVSTVLPNAVKKGHIQQIKDSIGNIVYDSLSFDMVNYIELIPVLIDYVQHQQSQIDSLVSQINQCCNTKKLIETSENNSTHISINLEDKFNCILLQNVPNPFGDHTQIRVLRSDTSTKAEILISTVNGIELQRISLGNTIENVLDIETSTLTSGVYLYSLIINGEIIDSKKMIKE